MSTYLNLNEYFDLGKLFANRGIADIMATKSADVTSGGSSVSSVSKPSTAPASTATPAGGNSLNKVNFGQLNNFFNKPATGNVKLALLDELVDRLGNKELSISIKPPKQQMPTDPNAQAMGQPQMGGAPNPGAAGGGPVSPLNPLQRTLSGMGGMGGPGR